LRQQPNAFLYFIPHRTQITRAQLDHVGIGYAFDSTLNQRQVVGNGPGGNGGVVVARGGTLPTPCYKPESQTWFEAEDLGVWIGYTGTLPTAEELAKPQQLAGQPVRLADGQDWTVPIARFFFRDETGDIAISRQLPSRTSFVNGEWVVGDVLERYQALWQVANAAFDVIERGGNVELVAELDAAVLALQANYYVGQYEAGLLGLFSTTGPEAWNAIKVLIGWDTYEDVIAKKNAPASNGEALPRGSAG
jgi:hypothetical protein